VVTPFTNFFQPEASLSVREGTDQQSKILPPMFQSFFEPPQFYVPAKTGVPLQWTPTQQNHKRVAFLFLAPVLFF